MRFDTPLIATILAALIFVGMFTIITSMGDNYETEGSFDNYSVRNGETSFNESFDRIAVSKEHMENITEEFEEQTVEDTGSTFPFLSMGFKIGKLMYNSVVIFKDMAFIVPELVGIPTSVVAVLVSLVIILAVIAILLFLLGRINL